MASPSAAQLSNSDLFNSHLKYTFRQLYYAVQRITNGYEYQSPEGQIVTDLYRRWRGLPGPGVYDAYQRSIFRMHRMWELHRSELPPTPEALSGSIQLAYRTFIQQHIPQCLAYTIDKKFWQLRTMSLPARQMVVTFRPFTDAQTFDFMWGVLHQKVEENRFTVLALSNGEETHWNRLGADVMETILFHAEDVIKQRWGQDICVGLYANIYTKIDHIFRESMEIVLENRIAQGRDDLYGVIVRTTPNTPPFSSGSPSSSRSSGSSGYNPAASMDME